MPEVYELMLELGHLVPMKPALWTVQVYAVDCRPDHLVAEVPVSERLRFCVGTRNQGQAALGIWRSGNSVGMLNVALMTGPALERSLVLEHVQACEEQRVICDLPERVACSVPTHTPSGHRTIVSRSIPSAA